jgi:hypothetical protein
MDDGSKEFAEELIARFGEDRFYHALIRFGSMRQARLSHQLVGGDESDWGRKVSDFRLNKPSSPQELKNFLKWEEDESYRVMCMTAFALSKHHKQYALKTGELPSSIHARMMLGQQNEWTKRYSEGLKKSD